MLYVAKKPLPLRIDEDLLRRVDEARGDVSRTRFVERALEKALGAGERAEVERMPPVARPGSASPRASAPREAKGAAMPEQAGPGAPVPSSEGVRPAARSPEFDAQAAAMERQQRLNAERGKRK